MKRIIDITDSNRDIRYNNKGYKLWFEDEGNNLYTIHCNLDYILEYTSINYDELHTDVEDYDAIYTDQNNVEHKCKNYSFDPSGGPFISIGNYIIEGKPIKRIFTKDNITYFEVKNN